MAQRFSKYSNLSFFGKKRSTKKRRKARSSKNKRVVWQDAPDIKSKIDFLCEKLELDWIDTSLLHSMRSQNSKTRAYARIWGLSKVWQKALSTKPAYIVEVISEKFDNLSDLEKDKVLLHELTHIPKNFSGSLVPHIRKGKRNFNKKVEDLYDLHLKGKK